MQQATTWTIVGRGLWCHMASLGHNELTHWGQVTHICIGNLTIIGSDNGLSPGWCQAVIWTNAAILLIGPLGTNFSEILIEINLFSFKKMYLNMSSGKWLPFCLSPNVLTVWYKTPETRAIIFVHNKFKVNFTVSLCKILIKSCGFGILFNFVYHPDLDHTPQMCDAVFSSI